MTSLGDGYGSGSGDGYCYGDGFGAGSGYDGFGSGYGEGYGYCYSDGAGYGDGSSYDYAGYGDGSSYDYGDSYGYGCGHGVLVATLGEYEVRAVVTPWGRVARVGCQVHALDTWRDRWHAIAREYDVEVSAEEVTRLIALIEEAPMGPEWLESEEGRRA